MKFVTTNMCTARQYCLVCRQKDEGREWRTLIGRIYETEGIDFPCPVGMPWIVQGQTFDPFAVEVTPQVKLPMDYGNLGDLVKKHDAELRTLLPNSRLIVALDEVVAAENDGSCRGCQKGKFMRKLGEFVRTLPEEEKLAVSKVIEVKPA